MTWELIVGPALLGGAAWLAVQIASRVIGSRRTWRYSGDEIPVPTERVSRSQASALPLSQKRTAR